MQSVCIIVDKHDKWCSIDINNLDQFCSGGTIFVITTSPAGPFMSTINGPAGPFMHLDQIFRYAVLIFERVSTINLLN